MGYIFSNLQTNTKPASGRKDFNAKKEAFVYDIKFTPEIVR